MARRRSPAITSRVMVLYRSSKICSGSNVFGKSTTFGNGKIGTIIVQRGYYSVSHPRSTPAEGRGQKAEGRRQKAEGRRQKAEGRRKAARGKTHMAEGRRQMAEGRRQKAEGRRQRAEGRTDFTNLHRINPQSAIEQLVCFRVIRVFPLVQSYGAT